MAYGFKFQPGISPTQELVGVEVADGQGLRLQKKLNFYKIFFC